MAWRVCPVEQGHRTDVYAYAVASADVPVDSNVGTVYAQLLGRFNWSPDAVSLMFSYDFPFLPEIGVYWQTIPPQTRMKRCEY